MERSVINELWPDEKGCKEGYHFRMGVWFHRNGWSQRAILNEEAVPVMLKEALKRCDGDVDKALELLKTTLIARSANG